MYDARMSAAAAHRMRARPRRPPPPPRLTHRESPHDRRRIPLEGLRKTKAWKDHQAFLQALKHAEEARDRWRRRMQRSVTSTADVTGLTWTINIGQVVSNSTMTI